MKDEIKSFHLAYIFRYLIYVEKSLTRAARVFRLTVQEQGIMKYHTSSCYKSFQRDMAKTDSMTQPLEKSEPSQQGLINDTSSGYKKLKCLLAANSVSVT